MSGNDCINRKGRIQILEDVTIKASQGSNHDSPQLSFRIPKPVQNRDKENLSNIADYTIVDYENNSRRLGSTYFSDEEPVFSDSEEEREYTTRILESQNITYASNDHLKKHSVEIQCEFAPYDQEIHQFAAKCAKFNVEEAPDALRELIQLCKHFSWKYHCNNTTPAVENFDKSTYLSESRKSLTIAKVSPEFMPSKRGSDDFKSETIEDRNIVNVSGVTENVSTRKSFKFNNRSIKGAQTSIRRSLRLRKLDTKSIAVINDKLSKNVDMIDLKKECSKITKYNNQKSNRKKRSKQTIEDIVQEFLYKSRKKQCKHSDPIVNDTHIRIPLPRSVVRPLARNWMKPQKNTINYHYLNYTDPKFSLLRGPRIRMLYSPRHWLQSLERTRTKNNTK